MQKKNVMGSSNIFLIFHKRRMLEISFKLPTLEMNEISILIFWEQAQS